MRTSKVSARSTKLRKAMIALLAVGSASVGMGLSASPAVAADGWNYIVIGNWNCPNGGSITQIKGAVYTGPGSYTQMWSGGDSGDNIVWAKVRLNQDNRFTGSAYCSRGIRSQWVTIADRYFRPTRANGTVWL